MGERAYFGLWFQRGESELRQENIATSSMEAKQEAERSPPPSQAGSREIKLEAGPSDTLSNLFFSDILPSSKAAPPEPPQTVLPTGDQVSKYLNL